MAPGSSQRKNDEIITSLSSPARGLRAVPRRVERRVRRHFDLYALWAELVTRSDLCRTPSCLAATEPSGAYGSRKRKREALET
jgi:hypothetical protein